LISSCSQKRRLRSRNRALIFDSTFDAYKGVLAYVRVFNGSLKRGMAVGAYATRAKVELLEVGYFSPGLVQEDLLSSGEIGYIATGLKDPGQIRVGILLPIQECLRIKVFRRSQDIKNLVPWCLLVLSRK